MPLRRFKCPSCGSEKETLKSEAPVCSHGGSGPFDSVTHFQMEQILVAPQSKMMETTDAFRGKSKQKNLNKILRERSRNYARDHEADEMISLNKANDLQRSGFLGKDGKKRKRIDDV